MTPETPPAVVGKRRRRGAPHTTALFWALWLLLFAGFVCWQLFT